MEILDGKKVAKKIKDEVKKKVEKIQNEDKRVPKLVVVMVGEDEASKVYVKNKSKACNYCGIDFDEIFLPSNCTKKQLLEVLNDLNQDKTVDAILVQSPIPKHLNISNAFKNISALKDVDGFTPENIGYLQIGEPRFIPCTPSGIIALLEDYKIEIEGKNVAIIGRSNIVGKPLMQYMLNKNATVTIAHSKTKDLKQITKNKDIIISCVGKKEIIKADMIDEGTIVIDVGINRTSDGKLVGDVDFDNVSKKASYITPVPRGIGPMTIACLMQNIVLAYELNKKDKLK